jgi:heat shock protein HtpX
MTTAALDEHMQRRHARRNAVQSLVLVAGSGALAALIAYSVYGPAGLLWAGLFGAAGVWMAGRVSPHMILELYKARALAPGELPDVHRVIRQLATAAGLPSIPRLYYVPSRLMNAFAVGNRADSAIAITDGMLRGLTLRQLAGVLAHEVSHIRSGHLRVMAPADVLSRLTSTMAMVGIMVFFVSLPVVLATGAAVPWLGILLMLLAPTLSSLLQLGLSRAREHDADFDAVVMTRDPEGLASALETLERRQGRLWERIALPGARLPDPSLLRTHPATADRVHRLLSLRKAGKPAIATVDETALKSGKTFIPSIAPPRVHWRRLGVWY